MTDWRTLADLAKKAKLNGLPQLATELDRKSTSEASLIFGEENVSHVINLLGLAEAYERKGDITKSQAHYREVLQILVARSEQIREQNLIDESCL